VRLKRPAEALEPLRAAIEASAGPDALEAYVLLARSYYALGRHEEAWFILSGLLEHWWQMQRPDLLLDAARTLLNLDRNLTLARTLLLELQRAGSGADPDYVASLLAEADRMLARPRRPIRR
jgi:tetratricopeptide (TPR) repeat protein